MKKSALFLSAALTVFPAFSAVAQDDFFTSFDRHAREKIEDYEKAQELCREVNEIFAPAFEAAGIAHKLRGDFLSAAARCDVYMGELKIDKYEGRYITSQTHDDLARHLADHMSYEELRQMRGHLQNP